MEMQSELFIRQNVNTPPEDPAAEETEQKTRAPKPETDPELMKMLERYVRSFTEMKDEIEVKGILIDFIRKI